MARVIRGARSVYARARWARQAARNRYSTYVDTAHRSYGGPSRPGGRRCGGIPCHHENLGPLGVPGSRMPVQPPGARTSGSLPRARPNLGLHAYLRPAHALQLCIEHGCKGDNMSTLSTAVLVQLYSVSRVRARRIVNWSSLSKRQAFAIHSRPPGPGGPALPEIRIRAHVPRPREHTYRQHTCRHAMQSSLLASARAWLSSKLAACAPAPAAFDARKGRRAPCDSTAHARGSGSSKVALGDHDALKPSNWSEIPCARASWAPRRVRGGRRRAHASARARWCRCRGCQWSTVCRNVPVPCLCIVMQVCW